MHWLRWSGLLVFICFAVLVGGILFFLVDPIIKSSIETGGARVVGAQVDVERVETNFLRGDITIFGFEMTNPQSPKNNLFSFEKAVFSLDFGSLFARKILINELTILDLKTESQRESEGKVFISEREEQKENNSKPALNLPTVELPSAEELLEKFPIQSVKKAQEIKSNADLITKKIKKEIENLPSEAQIKAHEARLKALKADSKDPLKLLAKAKDIKKTRDAIKSDLEKFKQLKKAISAEKKQLQSQIEELKKMPARDTEVILSKLGIGEGQGLNLVATLFGERVKENVETANYWYKKLAPYWKSKDSIEDSSEKSEEDLIVSGSVFGRGRVVEFSKSNQAPAFMLKKFEIEKTAEISEKILTGKGQNLSSDPKFLDAPTTIFLDGKALSFAKRASLDLVINHKNKDGSAASSSVKMLAEDYGVQDMIISKDANLAVNMASAKIDIEAKLDVVAGKLDGALQTDFTDLTLAVSTSDNSNELVKAIASTLSKVESFKLQSQLGGTVANPSFKFNSDLDNKIKTELGRSLKRRGEQLSGQLTQAITEKAGISEEELSKSLIELNSVSDSFKARESELKSLLSSI